VSSNDSDRAGAFPTLGPLPYLHLSPRAVGAALAGDYPPARRWYHGTTEAAAMSALAQGLLPGCWVGSGDCCVFGYDAREEIPAQRNECVLEIYSRALPGQLKAWWVPPQAIVGIWHDRKFAEAAALLDAATPSLAPRGAYTCELAELVAEQVALWREAVAAAS
jgi:hypothetical protein